MKRTGDEERAYRYKQEALANWSASHPEQLAIADSPAVGGCARPTTFSLPSRMCVTEVVAPVKTMCETTLSSLRGSVTGLVQPLRECWDKLHEPVWKADLRNLGRAPYDKTTPCRKAGFCLCTPHGQQLKLFVERLEEHLREVLSPKGVVRPAYDVGSMVMCLSATPRRLPAVDFYYFVGYGNLNDYCFTGLPLLKRDGLPARLAAVYNEVALAVNNTLPRSGVGNIWKSCKDFRR
jgi:hypothetical protein